MIFVGSKTSLWKPYHIFSDLVLDFDILLLKKLSVAMFSSEHIPTWTVIFIDEIPSSMDQNSLTCVFKKK